MVGEAERCCRLQHSVAVLVLLLSLAPSLLCLSLQKLSKKVQQDDMSEPAMTDMRNGNILFNGKKLDSQPGSSSSAATGNNGMVRIDSVQSDGPEMMLGQTLQLETAIADEAAWRRLDSTLLCGLTKMKLKVMGPGASYLQLDTGNANTLPLIQVPKPCGYLMQQNALGLVLVVPYNGCHVVQKNGMYVLPMSWLKNEVKLSCPIFQSLDAAATTSQPSTRATPTTQQSPAMNPAQYPYPYFPFYPYDPWSGPYDYFETTAPPATTTTAMPTSTPSPAMNPALYPYYFQYYPPYPWPRPHHAKTTVPPATTTTATPTSTPSPAMNPAQYSYPYFQYYQYNPWFRPYHHSRTTVPPATTTTTMPTSTPSPAMNLALYPYYFQYYPPYPRPRPHHSRTTVPPATTTTAAPNSAPSPAMNPALYSYPYFQYYQYNPWSRPLHSGMTVPPATTAMPTSTPSPAMNPALYPYQYFPDYSSYPVPWPLCDFGTMVPPATTPEPPLAYPYDQYYPYDLYYPYMFSNGEMAGSSNSSPVSQFPLKNWFSFGPYRGHRNYAGKRLDAWKHRSYAGYQSEFQAQAYPQPGFPNPHPRPWFSH